MKDKGSSLKVTQEYKDFIDNVRATRRSKTIGVDSEMLSQKDVGDLIVRYFKLNNVSFIELIKLKMNKNV